MSIFLLFILAFMALPVIKLVSSALTAQATQTFSFADRKRLPVDYADAETFSQITIFSPRSSQT